CKHKSSTYPTAMAKEHARTSTTVPEQPTSAGDTLHWPMSWWHLKSTDASALLEAATTVYETWLTYTDESQEIQSHTGETRHNTVTPIARQRDGQFELDLVLRNNRTSAEHPDGIFHTHADIHHIKRENIGLIEVMGLAVLPARLLQELQQVERFITGEIDEVAVAHADWAEELKQAYDGQDVTMYVEQAVAAKFVRGLEDCGVFKQTEDGQAAFGRFIQLVTRQPVEEQR
ncbi:MAG TPA: galactose-1-phosphate uridylyltransferase, partial [Exiguobacterium sp.]|nr:galactose-1-phosphate uridylyltransferase [Exiguobacterium sp.]